MNQFSKSTIERAREIIRTKKETDPIKAMLMSIEEENKILTELIENKTDRAKAAINTMAEICYESVNGQ